MMYATTLCVLLVVVGAFGQVDQAAFKDAKVDWKFEEPNKVTVTCNKFDPKMNLIAIHVVPSKDVVAPTVGTINSPDITTEPYTWTESNPMFVKGATINYWVRMQNTENKGFNSPTMTATL